MIDENYYQKWIEWFFENWALEDSVSSEKFYKMAADEVVELIKLTCLRCGSDLGKYSNRQIDYGLHEMFSPSQDFIFSFKECNLCYSDIVVALQSIKHLYTDLFNKRCDPVLSHLDEPTDNPLNSICYMLWDVTPLAFWDKDPNKKYYYAAIAGVMEKALYLSNPACIESALHGLGHIQDQVPDRVRQIIDGFLKKRNFSRPELVHYANNAKKGYIQ